MFETMSGFLWAFIPSFLLIGIGVVVEETLIRFEDKIFQFFCGLCRFVQLCRNDWKEYRNAKKNAI